MDKCKLTSDQIRDLIDGQTVQTSYETLGEYGWVDSHELEIVPEPLRCVECQHFLPDGDDSELCDSCCDKYMGNED